jgi:hypothetical protein
MPLAEAPSEIRIITNHKISTSTAIGSNGWDIAKSTVGFLSSFISPKVTTHAEEIER